MMDLMNMMRGAGESGRMENDHSVMADSFQGGVADIFSALQEQDAREPYYIDELQAPKQANQQQGNKEAEMLMMMLQALGGGL
jgi:hypothetical protein